MKLFWRLLVLLALAVGGALAWHALSDDPGYVLITLRGYTGLADAIADPAAASAIAVELINGGGNPNFLSPEGETFRWETESQLIVDTTPDGVGIGVPDAAVLQTELDAYAEVGLFGDVATPTADDWIDASTIASIYAEDGSIIYPGH